MHLFGRVREPDEMAGIWRQLYLTRASDEMVHKMGQDGGLVSAMLIWLREHDYIDAALVSGVEDDDAWKAKPAVVSTKEEILATAGSRYTYCANPLALPEAKEKGYERLALVGMGCQTSSPPVMWDRKAGKVSKPFLFNIGLLCSKTFDDAIFPELFEAKYGLKKQDMVKMNIKGVFQIWMKDGSYHEVDLKECHGWTRKGCTSCPDFAAEHSDVATGGIGDDNDWTLTIVRTELGEEVIERMIADGSIIAKPAQSDETAMRLLRLLSIVSRRRWPEFADIAPPPSASPRPRSRARCGRARSRPGLQARSVLQAGFEFDLELVELLVGRSLGGIVAGFGVFADLLQLVLGGERVDLGEHAVALLVGLGQRVDEVLGDLLGTRLRRAGGDTQDRRSTRRQRRGAGGDQETSSQRRHDSGRIPRCPCTPRWSRCSHLMEQVGVPPIEEQGAVAGARRTDGRCRDRSSRTATRSSTSMPAASRHGCTAPRRRFPHPGCSSGSTAAAGCSATSTATTTSAVR